MMLYQMATAAALITGLFGMWALVQAVKRRSDPRFKRGDDVLAGCGTCAMLDVCHVAGDETPDACPEDARRAHRQGVINR